MSTEAAREASRLWLLWKQAYEKVRADVTTGMPEAAGISEADLTVLVRLHAAGGTLRQNALAAVLGWDRTRLSHLLTRMEQRDYITRTKLPNGVEVGLLPLGQEKIDATLTPLEESARKHFLSRLTPEDAKTLEGILNRMLSP